MRWTWMLAAIGLAACSQTPAAPATQTETTTNSAAATSVAAGPGCTAEANRAWVVGTIAYQIDARLIGPDCARAVAFVVIRNPAGQPLYADAGPIAQIPLAFNPRADARTMQENLAAWIETEPMAQDASQLPAWPAGAATAPATISTRLSRAAYEAIRAEAAPLFCYPDSAESHACAALDALHGTITPLGSLRPEAARR